MAININKQSTSAEEKTGYYFLQVVRNAKSCLQQRVNDLQSQLDSEELSEELGGELRCAIGKANLIKKTLEDFEKMCLKHIGQDLNENYHITCDDLAGLWDVVFIHIQNMHKKFDNIAKLKAEFPISLKSNTEKLL